MELVDSTVYFGIWQYNPAAGTLLQVNGDAESALGVDGQESGLQPIVLEPRLHALLNYFLTKPEQVHAKIDLLDALWGHGEGTDAALMRAIALLRRVLQDTNKPATYIETLPKRGYRWVAQSEQVSNTKKAAVPLKIKPPLLQSTDAVSETDCLVRQPSLNLHHRPLKKQRRFRWFSVIFAVAVLALFASLLLFFGRSSYLPAFTQQITISAMAGQEQRPLLSKDAQMLFYQQQTSEQQWRWIAHDLTHHKKQVQAQQFSRLGAAQWYGQSFVFQAVGPQGCAIYKTNIDEFERTKTAWLACQQFVANGVAASDQELVWLDQHPMSGATQLWRLNGRKAELQQTFADSFRRPLAVLLAQQQVWVLLQQDDFNTSLFRYDLNTSASNKVADFPYAFYTLSLWDAKRLLLSSSAGSFIFVPEQSQLITLQLASGAFTDQQRVGNRLLASQVPIDRADLLPLQAQMTGRSSTLLAASPWLSSNKTDHLLSWNSEQAALVSERSGSPQIWWFDGQQIKQLTRFNQWRQITQLIWFGAELYAVIDQQLNRVSLLDGSLTAVMFQERQLRHFAICHGQWFWTEFTHQLWQLKTMNAQQHAIELFSDSVDLRCGPDQSLILQQTDGRLVRFWPEDGTQQELPWRINWRQQSDNSWTTTKHGIYWLGDQGSLWFAGWNHFTAEAVNAPELLEITAVYGQIEQEQVFLQVSRTAETDVVWLQPHQLE